MQRPTQDDWDRVMEENRSLRSLLGQFVGCFSQPKYHGWDMPQLTRVRDAAKQKLQIKD